MVEYAVVEAKPWHCGRMSRILRAEHKRAVAATNIHKEMSSVFGQSYLRRSALVDGRPVAMWGVIGTLVSAEGYVWLALSDEAARYPVAVLREAKRQLAAIMQTKRELATTIDVDDSAARRFAVFFGFHVAHDEGGSPATTKAERRRLLDYLDKREDIRLGDGKIIPMGLH